MKFGIEFDTKLNIPYAEQARMMKEHGFDASFIGLEADTLGEIVDALHQYDIEIESCHAPFDGINNMWLAGEAGDRMYERLTNSIDACAEYKIPVVVVHLSSGMKPPRMNDVGFERYDRLAGSSTAQEQIAVESGNGLVLIQPQEIRYISRDSRKTIIHCGEKVHVVKMPLAELEMIFADYDLVRCHQSFLVALSHVVGVEKSVFGRTYTAVLDTEDKIPVSRGRFEELWGKMTENGVIR